MTVSERSDAAHGAPAIASMIGSTPRTALTVTVNARSSDAAGVATSIAASAAPPSLAS